MKKILFLALALLITGTTFADKKCCKDKSSCKHEASCAKKAEGKTCSHDATGKASTSTDVQDATMAAPAEMHACCKKSMAAGGKACCAKGSASAAPQDSKAQPKVETDTPNK